MFAVVTPITTDDFLHLPLRGRSVVVDDDRDICRRRSVRVVVIQIISLFLCSLAANWRNLTEPRHIGVTHDV